MILVHDESDLLTKSIFGKHIRDKCFSTHSVMHPVPSPGAPLINAVYCERVCAVKSQTTSIIPIPSYENVARRDICCSLCHDFSCSKRFHQYSICVMNPRVIIHLSCAHTMHVKHIRNGLIGSSCMWLHTDRFTQG